MTALDQTAHVIPRVVIITLVLESILNRDFNPEINSDITIRFSKVPTIVYRYTTSFLSDLMNVYQAKNVTCTCYNYYPTYLRHNLRLIIYSDTGVIL